MSLRPAKPGAHLATVCAGDAQPGSHKSNIRHPYQDPDAGHPQMLWRSEEPFERRHGKSVMYVHTI